MKALVYDRKYFIGHLTDLHASQVKGARMQRTQYGPHRGTPLDFFLLHGILQYKENSRRYFSDGD